MNRVDGSFVKKLFGAVVLLLPILSFGSVIMWFSVYPIDPSPSFEASLANPLGLITSNFVYDGAVNVENILASSVFLLIVCLYYPPGVRSLVVYLLPFVTVGTGGLAELTAMTSAYANLRICYLSCSFYGMSGVASAAIGFTGACFLVSFGLIVLRKKGRLALAEESNLSRLTAARGQVVLVFSFVVYLLLLLLFSGLLVFPVTEIGHQTVGGGSSSAPAILIQTPPAAFVHSASIIYGFVLCLTILVMVNRRHQIVSLGRS